MPFPYTFTFYFDASSYGSGYKGNPFGRGLKRRGRRPKSWEGLVKSIQKEHGLKG